MSLVQTYEISQGWFTRNSSWQIFCFGGGVLGRIWLVPAKGSQLLKPRTSKGSNFTMVGHGFQALSVANVLLVLWCGEVASLKIVFSTFWKVEIHLLMSMQFCIAGGYGLQGLSVAK